MHTTWKPAVALVAALLMSQAASAQGRGNGKPAKAGEGKGAPSRSATVLVIVDHDGHRRVTNDYFRRQTLPPGLAKRDSLPPGLAKQLRERGQLPPGLQKHLIEVPGPLHSRLPRLPDSHHRYFLGRDLIVVESPSNQVIAIIRDVLR